jgi:hypothetical protein
VFQIMISIVLSFFQHLAEIKRELAGVLGVICTLLVLYYIVENYLLIVPRGRLLFNRVKRPSSYSVPVIRSLPIMPLYGSPLRRLNGWSLAPALGIRLRHSYPLAFRI